MGVDPCSVMSIPLDVSLHQKLLLNAGREFFRADAKLAFK
jgi:hypothetical protein